LPLIIGQISLITFHINMFYLVDNHKDMDNIQAIRLIIILL
jgi:hypothetical protein